MNAAAAVRTILNSQDSGVVDNDGCLAVKEEVRFQEWTEIAECDGSTATGLVACEP